MKVELAEILVDAVLDTGEYFEEDIRVFLDYKPRYQDSKTAGVVGLTPLQLLKIVIENADLFVSEFENDVPLFESIADLHVDDFGKSFIVY
jgi:hypothetical protein